MQAILVANPKGGSGKSTLTTNLAGCLAQRGQSVQLLDLDRQKSATRWLKRRPADLPAIGLLGEGEETADWLVIDSPAGLHGKNLDHALKLVGKIVVPVAPSLFDMQASQDFLLSLAEEKAVRKGRVDVAMVGMRMQPRTRAAVTLEQFLAQLDLPVLAYLRDAQVYVNVAFEGRSLFDLPPRQTARELENWQGLLDWLGIPAAHP
jgi:chromosome partitioning protein